MLCDLIPSYVKYIRCTKCPSGCPLYASYTAGKGQASTSSRWSLLESEDMTMGTGLLLPPPELQGSFHQDIPWSELFPVTSTWKSGAWNALVASL